MRNQPVKQDAYVRVHKCVYGDVHYFIRPMHKTEEFILTSIQFVEIVCSLIISQFLRPS